MTSRSEQEESMDLQNAHEMINDLWRFLKTFYCFKEDDAYWESLIEVANKLSKKYGSTFMDSLLLCCVDDIERRWKIATGNPFINPDPLKTLYEKLRKE